MSNLPLVSFILFAYRQAHLVREAVESAFAQNYSPMEILLSDDASLDGTYQIMQSMAAEYRGPHRIMLNRNERNMGLTSHFNRAMSLVHGEFIVVAAGDDRSRPNRVEVLVQAWLELGRPRGSLYSTMDEIDPQGNPLHAYNKPQPPPTPLPQWAKRPYALIYGASHAFHPDVYFLFGPLQDGRMIEDNPMAIRALALDGIFAVKQPLVSYRRHADNIASRVNDAGHVQMIKHEARQHELWVQVLEQVLIDVQHPIFRMKFGDQVVRLTESRCRKALALKKLLVQWHQCAELPVPWSLVKQAWTTPFCPGIGLRLLLRKLLPGIHSWLASRDIKRWRVRPAQRS